MNLKSTHFWLVAGIALLVWGSVVVHLGAEFPGFIICTIGSFLVMASDLISGLDNQ